MIKSVAVVFFLALSFSFYALAAENHLLADIEKQLNASFEDKTLLSVEKEQLEIKANELEFKIKNEKKLLVKRLKALSSLKQFNWGNFLLNPDLNELDRNIKILQNLNKHDYDLFKEHNLSLKQLAAATKNLAETEVLIQKKVELLKNQQDQFYRLEQAQIQSLQHEKKDSLLMHKGLLARPLVGSVQHEFGALRDTDNQFYLINRGELYITKAGAPVKAVGPGVVIFRDELARWRQTLIIQHADNYYSVYAGVKNMKKSIDDLVQKGDFLGATEGEKFYFELRHFENPINPKNWFRERL